MLVSSSPFLRTDILYEGTILTDALYDEFDNISHMTYHFFIVSVTRGNQVKFLALIVQLLLSLSLLMGFSLGKVVPTAYLLAPSP